MFIGVPSAPKCRTTSGTPVAATVSVSTMRAVPFVPSCAKIICASLSRRSPHAPLAAQRPRQTPVMSLRSIGAGADAEGTAAVLAVATAGVVFFPPGSIRRHQLSLGGVPGGASAARRPALGPSSHARIRAALGQGARRGPRLGGLTIRAVGRRPGRRRAALTATGRRKCRPADGATLAAMARSLGSRLPPALVERLSQRDLANRLGIALPFVTVDREGRPHAMLLSYLALRAYDSGTLGLVVHARSASARNLAERGGGTLLILEPDAVVYVKSRVVDGPLDVAGADALG